MNAPQFTTDLHEAGRRLAQALRAWERRPPSITEWRGPVHEALTEFEDALAKAGGEQVPE